MKSEKVEFEGHSGDRLAARLDRPDGETRAVALFAHCFTCGKDIAAARHIARALAEAGFAVLRFDFTGLGHSGGEFANTSFLTNAEDLRRAADWLRETHAAPQLLIGHSLGGAAAIAVAGDIPEVEALVTIGAPADPAHVLETIGSDIETIRREGEAEAKIAGRSFRISRRFVEETEKAALEGALDRLRKPLLVLHDPRDEIVGIDNATRIFLAAKHPKSFVSLDNVGHLVQGEREARHVAAMIAAWAGRYIAERPATEVPADVPEGFVRSREAREEGFLQTIQTAKHAFLADEPESYGGTDRGPTPYQLLSAALAACTSMTIRMYARRKKLALRHVSVDVSHEKIHAADCEDCETREGKVDRFERVVTLEGDLDAETRAKLLEIADKCPVHRTLESEISIVTRAAD